MLDRRRFSYTLVGGLMAFGLGRWTAGTAGASSRVSLDGPLSRDVFLALVQEPFSLLVANRSVGLVLVKVEDAVARPDSEQFTLVFQGSRQLDLSDGVYRITHRTAGTTQLFLQPAGHDDRHTYYKAPFDLLGDHAAAPGPAPEPSRSRWERPLYSPRK